MSLRSAGLKIANTLRGLGAKPAIDIYTTSVKIVRRTWGGGRRGVEGGTLDEDLVVFTPRPKVRELSGREITGSGGRYRTGDVLVGPFTPAHLANSGIGYTPDQLAPTSMQNGVEYLYVLTGTDGSVSEYGRVDLKTDRPFKYELVLRAKRTTP